MSSSSSKLRVDPEIEEDDEESTFEIDTSELFHSGTFLNNRYIIIVEIGRGANAIVYLAYDIKDNSRKSSFYAIKIQNHISQKGGEKEIAFLEEMRKKVIKDKLNPDDTHINHMLDNFKFIDPDNEKHVYYCMVFEVYERSLYPITESGSYKYGIDIFYVKSIAKQILQGLNFLNHEMGIIFTDLKLENILYCGANQKYVNIMNNFIHISQEFMAKVKDIQSKANNKLSKLSTGDDNEALKIKNKYRLSIQEVAVEYLNPIVFDYLFNSDNDEEQQGDEEENEDEENSSSRKKEQKVNKRRQERNDYQSDLIDKKLINIDKDTVSDFDKKPLNKDKEKNVNYQVITAQQLRHIYVALTDFGSSIALTSMEDRMREISPRFLRAPEVILGLQFDEKVDVWAFGTTIFQLITGYELFDTKNTKTNHEDKEHLYTIVKQFGPIPQWMIDESPRKEYLFDATRNYQIRGLMDFKPYSLKQRLIEQFRISEDDIDPMWEFLKHVFVIDPKKRLSVRELLGHPWLNNSDWLVKFMEDRNPKLLDQINSSR